MCDLEALLPGPSHWHLLLARCSTTAAVASLPERSCQVIPAPQQDKAKGTDQA